MTGTQTESSVCVVITVPWILKSDTNEQQYFQSQTMPYTLMQAETGSGEELRCLGLGSILKRKKVFHVPFCNLGHGIIYT